MKKKFLYACGICLILVCIICQVVNAFSFTPTLSPNKNVVQEETEVTVKVKISNLDAGNGINKFVGILDYDSEIFEEINSSNIEGLTKWIANYDSETKKVTVTRDAFVNESQDILQIALKVKKGTYGKSGTVSLKNIVATCSENDIIASDISTTISIGYENSDTQENTTVVISPANNTVNNTVVNNEINVTAKNTVNNVVNTVNNVTNTASNNVVNKTTNTAKNNVVNGTVPYTGVDDTVASIVIALIALALVFYFKIEKINEDLK